ncbi:MAG: hypothetical protein ACO1NM_05035 [Sphingobium phenoxybenzoativorans]
MESYLLTVLRGCGMMVRSLLMLALTGAAIMYFSGGSPADLVSSAFHTTRPVTGAGWRPDCEAMMQQFESGSDAPPDQGQGQSGNLAQSMGTTFKSVMQISAFTTKLRAAGCSPESRLANYEAMTAQLEEEPAASGWTTKQEIVFEPGKPMVDVSMDRPAKP